MALVLAALVWIAAFLFGPDDLPDLRSPLGTAYLMTATAVALLSPWLLLPVGSSASVTYDDDGVLSVVTVLGVQHVDLGDLRRVGALTVYTRGGQLRYLYLRSAGARVAWVEMHDTRSLTGDALTRLHRTVRQRPGIVTARGRARLRIDPVPGLAHRFALGALTCAVAIPLYGLWSGVVLYAYLVVAL